MHGLDEGEGRGLEGRELLCLHLTALSKEAFQLHTPRLSVCANFFWGSTISISNSPPVPSSNAPGF